MSSTPVRPSGGRSQSLERARTTPGNDSVAKLWSMESLLDAVPEFSEAAIDASLRSDALAAELRELFLGSSIPPDDDRAEQWRHSAQVGLAARMLAESLRASGRAEIAPEDAFAAGLLHDIGKLILEAALPQQYYTAIRALRRRGLRLIDIENKLFPFTHAMVGAALAARLKLPVSWITAIGYHHAPEQAELDQQLAAIVALANELVDYLDLLTDGPEQMAELAPVLQPGACALLKVETNELPGFIVALKREIEESEALSVCLQDTDN